MVVDIQRDILRENGVSLPYKHAWLGKQVAWVILHVSEVASYNLLLQYISKMDLCSIAIVDKDGEWFRRIFFSFYACVLGFKRECKPLLLLDRTHLLGKYGALYSVRQVMIKTTHLFHVPFAVFNIECRCQLDMVSIHTQ